VDRRGQRPDRTAELVAAVERFQSGEELAAKDAAEDLHGQEERIAWADPLTVIRRESAGGNGAVNVRMEEQVLSPSMQDADDADLGAQVFAIHGDLEQGLSTGGEQQVVEQTWVLQGQHIEFVRHSEHDVEVAGGQEFAFAGRQPALASLRLALGAVSVSARVVRDSLMTAAGAGIPMTAQRSGAAAQNGAKGFELLKAKTGSIAIQEAIALHA